MFLFHLVEKACVNLISVAPNFWVAMYFTARDAASVWESVTQIELLILDTRM